MEKDYALAASLKLKEDLQSMGYVVYMTRESDTYPELMTRANMANSLKVDIFISMHANSADPNRAANGIEVWYSGVSKVGDYSSLEKKFVRIEEELQKIQEQIEKVNKKYLLAGEKNNVDELMSLQEELDNLNLKIIEKFQEWEETEEELKVIKG